MAAWVLGLNTQKLPYQSLLIRKAQAILLCNMAWFFIIISAILLTYLIKGERKMQEAARLNDAALNAMVSVAITRTKHPEEVAYEYLCNLDNTLLDKDYDKFMQNLCRANGLTYKSDDGSVMANDIRSMLAEKLSKEMKHIHNRVKMG